MALAHPLFVGFSSASRLAREGGDLEVTVETEEGPRTFLLPWFFVRQVDALLERWRREEHDATLLTMNDGVLGATLVEAARAGGLRDVTFLLAHGADIEHSHELKTPLLSAARHGHLAVVNVLLDAGAEELAEALFESARGGQTHVAALLLDQGVDVHSENDFPLQLAVYYGHLETARYFLDQGADVRGDDDLAISWAREYGHEAIVALLLERGAVDIPVEEDEGEQDGLFAE